MSDNRGAISLSYKVGTFGRSGSWIHVRGWHPTPSQIARIEIRSTDGTLITETNFSEDRHDVVKNESSSEGNPRCGFNVVLQRDDVLSDEFNVDFFGSQGDLISRKTGSLNHIADFFIERLQYDEPSRRLTYLGRFLPTSQCRGAMIGAGARVQPITKLFEKNPETMEGQFDWFYGVAQPVNPNDLKGLQFIFFTIDGKKWSLDISSFDVTRNPALLDVEAVSFNFLNDDLEISGWCRSFGEFSHLSFELGDQELYCMPTIGPSKRVQEQHGFRGPASMEWKVSTKITGALDNPEILRSAAYPALNVKLMSRKTVVAETRFKLDHKSIASAAIDFCLYNQNDSQLTIIGRASDSRIAGIKASRRGQLVAKIDIQSSTLAMMEPGSPEPWDWIGAAEINARLNAGELLEIEFFDKNGASLAKNGVANSSAPVMRSTAPGFIEGQRHVARHMFEVMCQKRKFDSPLIMVVFPGSMAAGGGGGSTRMVQLLAFLKSCGFAICLVDRSELWDIAAHSKNYTRLMENIDFHIPLGGSVAREIAALALSKIAEEQDKFSEALHSKLERALEGKSNANTTSVIERRSNEVFNQMAAFFAWAFQPRVFLSSFAWTASAFDSLPSGITRILDAHDVQSERYKSFNSAHRLYGDAVPKSIVEEYAQNPVDEAKLLNKADVVLALSIPENRLMQDMIGSHKVLLAGFGLSNVTPLPHNPSTKKLLFVGNNYLPNIFAIKRFAEIAFPKIRAAHPDAELHICGSVCRELDIPANAQKGVVLRGFVPDLTAEYASSAIVINPVQFGSGLSIKTPEALAFGKAVVCSPYIGTSLANLAEREAAIIAPIEEMYKPISQLLSNSKMRATMEQKASTYAQQCLMNEVVLADLLNMLETKLFY